MLQEYSCTKCESLAQIHATITELQHFSKGLFFIGALCISVRLHVQSSLHTVSVSSYTGFTFFRITRVFRLPDLLLSGSK